MWYIFHSRIKHSCYLKGCFYLPSMFLFPHSIRTLRNKSNILQYFRYRSSIDHWPWCIIHRIRNKILVNTWNIFRLGIHYRKDLEKRTLHLQCILFLLVWMRDSMKDSLHWSRYRFCKVNLPTSIFRWVQNRHQRSIMCIDHQPN